MRALPSPLLVVTDRHGHKRPLSDTVQAVLDGGARWIWFRDRDLSEPERRGVALRLAALVRAAGGVLGIGADLVLAAEVGAGGVHLGGGSGRAAIAAARASLGATARIGVSAHSLRDVAEAAGNGADYVTLSPIFPTASKPGYGPALGLDAIAAAASIGPPVIALGGIDAANAAACRTAGAAGVAVMGGVMRADDPAAAAGTLLKAWSDVTPLLRPSENTYFAAAGP